MQVKVVLALNLCEPLAYEYTGDPARIGRGMRVLVPLGKRTVSGWVLGEDAGYRGALKPVLGIVQGGFSPDEPYLDFVLRVAAHFRVGAGMLLDLALPPAQKALRRLRTEVDGRKVALDGLPPRDLHALAAAGPLSFSFSPATETRDAAPVARPPGFSSSMHIGSGRERIYAESIGRWNGAGYSALLAVPDTVTAAYWHDTLAGISPYHSDLRPKEKEAAWHSARAGEPRTFAGSLSALFLPLANLGGIIVDRAGCGLYHSSLHSGLELPEVARIRAEACGVPLVSGSSAHTLSSYQARGTTPIADTRQPGGIPAETVPLKKGKRNIPAELLETLQECCRENRRAWVILSRKTGGALLYCPRCQKVAVCSRCQNPLPASAREALSCPGCSAPVPDLAACPSCRGGWELLQEMGMDTLAEEIRRKVSESGLLVLEGAKSREAKEWLAAARESRIVLSGPQLISPYFRSLFDTIIYFRPESLFRMNRFKVAEQIFGTVAELKELVKAGGRLILFSAYHFHYAFSLVNREEEFWERELKYREWFMLPPYAQVYELEIRDADLRRLAGRMRRIATLAGPRLRMPRIALAARRPQRGTFRGIIEIHGRPEDLEANGLFNLKGASLTRINE